MTQQHSALDRRAVVARILRQRDDSLVVASLGNPCYDLMSLGDRPDNFYLMGAMGGCTMLALGLALAQPARRVLALVGDGELMMALGSLATIAVKAPRNLSIVVIDNEHYAETGMQAAHSGRGVDLVGVARAVGIKTARLVRTVGELDEAASSLIGSNADGLAFVDIKVRTEPSPPALPPRDGAFQRSRFRANLLGAQAHA
jgi:thiamine pyrophosphate-dependent acetolactate synthase large subunit-like protein